DHIKSLTLSDIRYEGSISSSDKARTFARGIPKPLLTTKFKQLLASLVPINAGEMYWVSEYFTKIRQLQLEWQSVGYKGFVTKDIAMGEPLYNVLLKMLDKIWDSGQGDRGDDEGDEGREHQRWMTFLRCIRVDYWPRERKAVVIAPLFAEDKAFMIANTVATALHEYEPTPGRTALQVCRRNYHVQTADVWCRLMYNAVRIDAMKNTHAEACPFFCIVAQTAEEFMYETKKMALIVKSGKLGRILGFIVVLVREAGHDIEPAKLFKSKALNSVTYHMHWKYPSSKTIPSPNMECRVLFYTSGEIDDFVGRAGSAVTLEDWERSSNFMWLTGYSCRVASSVPEHAWKQFNHRARRLIMEYVSYINTTRHFYTYDFAKTMLGVPLDFDFNVKVPRTKEEKKGTVEALVAHLFVGIENSVLVAAADSISLAAGLGRASVKTRSMGLRGDGHWRYSLFA
ncbi:uncharacterized protein C8Q71DRAFT_739711, partial [Rhodofomes roseus]